MTNLDLQDAIVASAAAPGGAARAVVRISGPTAAVVLDKCFAGDKPGEALPTTGAAIVAPGRIAADLGGTRPECFVPVELYWWPTARSYTRQPVGELHLPGSPPLVEAVVETLCRHGARPARPGEFTLRAFLAGRIDLPQAEAVLGVIDARDAGDLDAALVQLAGGLSGPLHELRDELLHLLADLEAGLDFADEEIEFIAADELQRRLADVRQHVAATIAQLQQRGSAADCPRVVLAGPPNAGKSSLFNALAKRYAAEPAHAPAIVSDQAGTTRDYLVTRLNLAGIHVDLVDTAGADETASDAIELSAQRSTDAQRRVAEVLLMCLDASAPSQASDHAPGRFDLILLTKADLLSEDHQAAILADHPTAIAVSSRTDAGIAEVAAAIGTAASDLPGEVGQRAVAATATRSAASLREAEAALASALALAEQSGVEELVAAEVRTALDSLGEVVGAVYVDDVLDRVFSQFCIGK